MSSTKNDSELKTLEEVRWTVMDALTRSKLRKKISCTFDSGGCSGCSSKECYDKFGKFPKNFNITVSELSSPLRRATIQILKTLGSSISWTMICQKMSKIPLTASPSTLFSLPHPPPFIAAKFHDPVPEPVMPPSGITKSNVETDDNPSKLDGNGNRESVSKPIIRGVVKSGPRAASLGTVSDIVRKGYRNFVLSSSTKVHATKDSPVNGGGLSQNGKFSSPVFDSHDGAHAAKYVKECYNKWGKFPKNFKFSEIYIKKES
ncbi:hypothetical protein RJT34_30245 [Clitoria ternatea]|uniref:Uncharacterized protein n=1 Tax=Clitoria ternatea TaxID=43366 RepID=A0AAN9EU61_CLITE